MGLWILLQVGSRIPGRSRPVMAAAGTSCDLLQGCLLFVNAVAILNNDRFLEKSKRRSRKLKHARHYSSDQSLCAVGWGYSQIGSNNLAAHPNALKSQLIGGLHAVAYLRGEVHHVLASCCMVRLDDDSAPVCVITKQCL